MKRPVYLTTTRLQRQSCQQIYNGLLAKFSQSPDLKRKLLNTDDSLLAECAVKDTIWGIGISMKDDSRYDITKWKGQNLLGFALMEVRKVLEI